MLELKAIAETSDRIKVKPITRHRGRSRQSPAPWLKIAEAAHQLYKPGSTITIAEISQASGCSEHTIKRYAPQIHSYLQANERCQLQRIEAGYKVIKLSKNAQEKTGLPANMAPPTMTQSVPGAALASGPAEGRGPPVRSQAGG